MFSIGTGYTLHGELLGRILPLIFARLARWRRAFSAHVCARIFFKIFRRKILRTRGYCGVGTAGKVRQPRTVRMALSPEFLAAAPNFFDYLLMDEHRVLDG